MADTPQTSPVEVIANSDPGDDTANRYRFQWTWAAIMCCALLDKGEDVDEVFCEHHEDVLIRHRDGLFTGHQVKTRNDDQPPWKANDDSVISACVRFVKLENEFPGQFRHFLFVTNHPLFAAENSQCLTHVLESIAGSASVSELPQPILKWLRRVARDADVSELTAWRAISKTIAKDDLPKLRDGVMRLIDTIAQCWAPGSDCSLDAIRKVAFFLIDECGRASSLGHQQLLMPYLISTPTNDVELVARINGKQMTVSRVLAVLEQGRDSKAILEGNPSQILPPGQGSTDLLHSKLAAGGFSANSQNSAEDLRDKADYLGIKWTKQHGNEKGLLRYDHVRSLVLSDASRAYDASATEEDKFGPAMREDLRKRFQERRINGDQLFDCTDDHLEGVAFSLTAQCKVMWSRARPWEGKHGSR